MSKLKKRIAQTGIGLLVIAAGIQAVPYGRDHTNPPVKKEPAWDSPATRELVARACFDCHSNETKWRWYSHVAPMSWLVANHVAEGREHLNFSEMDREQKHAKDAAEEVEEKEMPLPSYLIAHPEARLSDSEREALVRGLAATFGKPAEGSGEHGHDHEHK